MNSRNDLLLIHCSFSRMWKMFVQLLLVPQLILISKNPSGLVFAFQFQFLKCVSNLKSFLRLKNAIKLSVVKHWNTNDLFVVPY